MIIYPKKIFYPRVKVEDVHEIISKTIIKGDLIERLLYVDPETKEKKYIDKEIIRDNFVSKEYIKVVQKGFRAAVTRGSARYLRYFKPEVAGKTGTAEVKGKKPHAWFTCFAPYRDPKIVLTILIENGGEGFRVAVPLAKEILDWYWKHQKDKK